jgi:hypothetical protein
VNFNLKSVLQTSCSTAGPMSSLSTPLHYNMNFSSVPTSLAEIETMNSQTDVTHLPVAGDSVRGWTQYYLL